MRPGERATMMGRGDTLNWLGRSDEARVVFGQAVELGHIPNVEQRTGSAGFPHYNPALPRQPYYAGEAAAHNHHAASARRNCSCLSTQIMKASGSFRHWCFAGPAAPLHVRGGAGGGAGTPGCGHRARLRRRLWPAVARGGGAAAQGGRLDIRHTGRPRRWGR